MSKHRIAVVCVSAFVLTSSVATESSDIFDTIFHHCSGDERNVQNDGGRSSLDSDWGVGDCVMRQGSNMSWDGDVVSFQLFVKTNHTSNRDIFHVQWFWGDRTATNEVNGPDMHEGDDFQEWTGSATIGGADPNTLSRPVVWWRACC